MTRLLHTQEIAGNHAVGLWGRADNGFANVPALRDLIFVMTRLQIRMLKYPKWCAHHSVFVCHYSRAP
jgi:hypothetical protein